MPIDRKGPDVSSPPSLGLLKESRRLSLGSVADRARGERGEFTARTNSVRSSACGFNIDGAREAELPFLPFFNPSGCAPRRVNRYHRDLVEFEVLWPLQRSGERSIQLRRDEHSSRVLRRGLSYDPTTGRLPVDVNVEISWRSPAETRGSSTSSVGNAGVPLKNHRLTVDHAFSPTCNSASLKGTPHPPIPQYPFGFFARYCW